MKRLVFKFYPRELLFSILLVLIPVSSILESNFPDSFVSNTGYIDEVLCVICSLYILYLSFKKGIKGIDLALLIILLICTAWGFLCNIVSKVNTDWFPIVVDAICLLKIFVPFIMFKRIADADKKMVLIDYLVPAAKLLIITGAFFGLISMFFDIGMTGDSTRYGIPQYNFIFVYGSRYGYMVACGLMLLNFTNMTKKQRFFYEVLSLFSMIIITKGVVYIVVVAYLLLKFLWRGNRPAVFTPSSLVIIAIGILAVSGYQIDNYLRNFNSPRMLFIRYGFETANTYFPFGSGFATYGSDMAARYYSPLYYLYGFDKAWGMSPDNTAFLNDCYLGMLFGQFGYIGFLLFVIMLIIIFSQILNINFKNKNIKAMEIALFAGIVISSIGTAIIKSSTGVLVFSILGMVCGYSKQQASQENGSPLLNNPRPGKIKIRLR